MNDALRTAPAARGQDMNRNWPATADEALVFLARSAVPSVRIETLGDLLAGRPGRIVRRLRPEVPR
jgi:hypothetical protein